MPTISRTPPGTFGLRILGVSEVARAVREAVRADERLRDVWVEGEVTELKRHARWASVFFTLKDPAEIGRASCRERVCLLV